MIIFLRSYSISKDSRLLKYISICKENNIRYKIIGWDKDHNEQYRDDAYYFKGGFKLGKKWLNVMAIFKWWIFIFYLIIFRVKNNITAIHSVDLDCGIVGLIISKLLRAKHIYDIYDVYSANRNMRGLIKALVDSLERFVCRKSTYFIMPESFRFEQLGIDQDNINYNNFIEIENVPQIDRNIELRYISPGQYDFYLAYAGSLEPRHRGLENLLKAVSICPNVFLDIAGVGPLTALCKKYSQQFNNICFHGGLTPQQVYELEAKAQIIIGMYYKTRDNHLFASPNKYYEHLALGKVMLTTSGTPPGMKVEKYKTGFAIGESLQDIIDFLQSLNGKEDIIDNFSINAYRIWVDKYSDYNERYLSKQYMKMVGK